MNSLLVILVLVLCAAIFVLVPASGPMAVLACIIFATITGLIISQLQHDKQILLSLFLGGLLIRMVVGTIIFVFNLQEFFGGDAITYDFFGWALVKVWSGERYYQSLVDLFIGREGSSGWGMVYLVAIIYRLIGRNMLAIQFFNAVIGAATTTVIYLCALHIYANVKVARIAALFVAFFPSLVLWSSQGLKDGPIVFLLAISVLATLKLGDKLNLKYFLVLVCALFSLLSFRFYIFYMMVMAVGGAFVIGMRTITAQSFARQVVVVAGIGLALTYFGVLRYASGQIGAFGNLEAVQTSRRDAAQRGESGFGRDVDVSTTSGAIKTIPVGITYLLFAPFPWQLASLRQSITLPEMLVWWAAFPLLVLGLWYTIKYRLRQASPILIFTTMLTLAYSVFQGNIGNAYRQRAQLLVFYFMFVAVGFVLVKERRDYRRRQAGASK